MGQKLPDWFGEKRIFNHHFENVNYNIIRWEVLPIQNRQRLKVRFVNSNSVNRQGIRIAIDVGKGNLKLNGVTEREFVLWEDKCPKEFEIECTSEKGLISLYNIFEQRDWTGRNITYSQMDFSGMILEQKGNVYRYKCNNAELKDDFDKLVFEIELL